MKTKTIIAGIAALGIAGAAYAVFSGNSAQTSNVASGDFKTIAAETGTKGDKKSCGPCDPSKKIKKDKGDSVAIL